MNNKKGSIWGILLIVIGVLFAGRVLGIFSFRLLFSGWWTLFLIIPSAVSLMSEKGQRSSALRGLLIGVMLLLTVQGFIKVRTFFPLLVALLMVLFGAKLIRPSQKNERNRNANDWENEPNSQNIDGYGNYNFRDGHNIGPRDAYYGKQDDYDPFVNETGWKVENDSEYHFTAEDDPEYEEQSEKFFWNDYGNRDNYRRENGNQDMNGYNRSQQNGYQSQNGYYRSQQNGYQNHGGVYHSQENGRCACTAVFSGKQIRYDNQKFSGAALSAVFGGIDLDLTHAYFEGNVNMTVSAVFGGVDIIVPKDVRVEVVSSSIFGGVDVKKPKGTPIPATRTLYLKANCLFGGVDIRTSK